MKYIVLTIEYAKILFTDEELETHRKSVDGTKVIMHEETLIEKRNAMGLAILSSEELNNLLNSKEWNDEVLEDSTTDKSEIYSTSKKVEKSYWNF